jgi:hypothetical protein
MPPVDDVPDPVIAVIDKDEPALTFDEWLDLLASDGPTAIDADAAAILRDIRGTASNEGPQAGTLPRQEGLGRRSSPAIPGHGTDCVRADTAWAVILWSGLRRRSPTGNSDERPSRRPSSVADPAVEPEAFGS